MPISQYLLSNLYNTYIIYRHELLTGSIKILEKEKLKSWLETSIIYLIRIYVKTLGSTMVYGTIIFCML